MEKTYPENCTVIRVEDDNPIDQKRANAIKYWTNACGETHMHGKYDISPDELPKPLRRAYNDIWEEGAAGCCCYLVETKNGYGVALVAEYDEYYANECRLSMDELFNELLKDMESLAAREELWTAEFYALEYAGLDECHELVIVLPANIPARDWDAAKHAVEETVYKHSNDCRTSNVIREKITEYHTRCGHRNIEIGEVEFKDPDYAVVSVKFDWMLNSWEKHVDSEDVLVRGQDGFWTLVQGFGFERFKA